MTDNLPGPRLSNFSRDVVRAALVDIVSKSLVAAVLMVGAVVALLIVEGGSVPAWVAALLLALAGATALITYRRYDTLRNGLARRDAQIEQLAPLPERVRALESDIEDLDYVLSKHEVYGAHLAEVLDHLQRVVVGDIAIPINDYIVRGILEPARDVLLEEAAEDIRLSVLIPEDDGTFWMPWAAGHNLNSQHKYKVPIAKTLARLALEEGRLFAWDDVTNDDRFEANPRATREIRSMVSVPLTSGDQVIGVLNCVASLPDAFDGAEQTYLVSLASVLGVTVNVSLNEGGEADSVDA